MQRFSGFSLFRRGLSGHRDWQPQWRKPEPKPAYDAVIVGAERKARVIAHSPYDAAGKAMRG